VAAAGGVRPGDDLAASIGRTGAAEADALRAALEAVTVKPIMS
jgi:hypothetical protein